MFQDPQSHSSRRRMTLRYRLGKHGEAGIML